MTDEHITDEPRADGGQTVDEATAETAADADLAAIADAVEGNEADLAALLDRVEEVTALLDILALGTSALDDDMVVKLAQTGGNLGAVVDAAAEPETVRGVESVLHAVGDATGDLEAPPEPVGIVGLLRALRDPEVQAGLGFLVAVSRHLGRDLERRSALRSDEQFDRVR